MRKHIIVATILLVVFILTSCTTPTTAPEPSIGVDIPLDKLNTWVKLEDPPELVNSHIRFWSLSGHGQGDIFRMVKNVVHELGHAYDNSLGYYNEDQVWIRRSTGMTFTRDVLRPNRVNGEISPRHWDWQQSPSNNSNEIYADMFIAWTYNAWNFDINYAQEVSDAQEWMP